MNKDHSPSQASAQPDEQQRRQLADDLGFLMARQWLEQRARQGRGAGGDAARPGARGTTDCGRARRPRH